MGEAFRLGGFGMIPTTIVGLLLIAAAVQCARRPDPRRFRIVRYLSLLTMLVGSLGFVSGVIKSFLAAGQADLRELPSYVVTGVGEALNCIGLGLSMLVIAWIAAAIGAYRDGARDRESAGSATLTDPHRP